MKNRVQTVTAVNNAAELTDTELQAVTGGLNPQPLPPRVEYSALVTNVAVSAFQGMIAWG